MKKVMSEPWVPVIASLRECARAIDVLACALEEMRSLEDSDRANTATGIAWPDVMSTTMAARYCGYKTGSALRKANREGKVFPAGRRGGAGSNTWAKAELDRFLRGDGPDSSSTSVAPRDPPRRASAPVSASRASRRTASPPARPAIPSDAGSPRRKLSKESEDALRRLKELAKRGRCE